MAYGVTTKRKMQFGAEASTAQGTAVAATQIWRGPAAQIESGKTIVRPAENIGKRVMTDRTYIPFELATLAIPETEATYEQLPIILTSAVDGLTAGVADGTTGTGKIYEYESDDETDPTPTSMTIEAGDNNDVSDLNFAMVQDFTIRWTAREGAKISANYFGQKRTTGQAFASLSPIAVEEILTPSVYIDATTATIGTTQLSGTLIGYELSYTSGIQPIVTADGQTYFGDVKYVQPSCTLSMTYEHDGNATTEYDAFAAGTTRKIRIEHLGSSITQGDGSYANKTFRIDGCFVYDTFPPYTDQEGDNIITATMTAGWNSDADLFVKFLVVNLLASIL